MDKKCVGILHYSAPPVIGGVEAVMEAHTRVLVQYGYPTTIIAGRGEGEAVSPANYIDIPLADSQHPDILAVSEALEEGRQPEGFETLVNSLSVELGANLAGIDVLIVHNIFTKHFNLPLTAALHRLLDEGSFPRTIAWTHDITWTSPNSRSKVHPGYPWDLLRTQHPLVTYTAVSKLRRRELAGLFDCPPDEIDVVNNGVDPQELLGLSQEGWELVNRLGLLESDLNLLMPVRVTQAKNIEYALSVLNSLKNHYPRPTLVLSGPPDPHDPGNMDYYATLLDLRAKLGLEDRMHFVYESGTDPKVPYEIASRVVGDLYRASDVMFMPSHREGFGMPVLEAGLAGLPVVSTGVPASKEIAEELVVIFNADQPPQKTAGLIYKLVENNPISRMRRLVRTKFTWSAIFDRKIKPLLEEGG